MYNFCWLGWHSYGKWTNPNGNGDQFKTCSKCNKTKSHWIGSRYKFPPYTEEQYAEILAWVMGPDD